MSESEAKPAEGPKTEVIKPALAPVLVSVGVILAAVLLVSIGLLFLAPVPSQVAVSGSVFIAFVIGIAFMIIVWNDVYIYLTQFYEIDEDTVRISVGFVTKQAQSIDRRNIASVTAVMPFPQRMFGIGSVKIATTDGYKTDMINVKGPLDISRRIEPKPVA